MVEKKRRVDMMRETLTPYSYHTFWTQHLQLVLEFVADDRKSVSYITEELLKSNNRLHGM